MNTEEPINQRTLHQSVNDLTTAVQALERTLKSDYPTRIEVRKRRIQVALGMVIAIIASYFFTVGTISYCFLSGIPEKGTHQFCYIFPGYEESFENNKLLQQRFFEMEDYIKQNRELIDEFRKQNTDEP